MSRHNTLLRSEGKHTATALWKNGISLIPYPQDVVFGGEDFLIRGKLIFVLGVNVTEESQFVAGDLIQRLRDRGIKAEINNMASPNHHCIVLTTQSPSLAEELGQQGYVLSASARKITIAANGEAGLFYGTRTLLQLLQKDEKGLYVRGMVIRDWPDITYRAVHYDTKHHQDKADYVKRFIRQLADYKINMLVWEWEDKFAYQCHPEIGAPGAFAMAEMQEITRYAKQYHVQLVPLVQGLGHASYILKWPQYAHLREIPASNWEFCPLKAGSYKLLFDLWSEAIEATPGSEFLHIGTDETYELGLGEDCGCRDKTSEVGRRGLLLYFINRCVDMMGPQRKIISWGGEYKPGEVLQPAMGLIVAEFSDDVVLAEQSRDAGYPAWVYDPNPGIEHLFLPYFYRMAKEKEVESCLQVSHRRLTNAAVSGYYEGMINTSWDDSGLHNQIWMMSFINSAECSWSGAAPELEEFVDKFFVSYYGPEARDMRELWMLLNKSSYYYMDTFERKVWHWGAVGKTHLPDLPRGDIVEYDLYWNKEYAHMVERSQHQLHQMGRAIAICQANLQADTYNRDDFVVFITIAELIAHTARTYLMLSEIEHKITQAHKQHFISHAVACWSMEEAARLIESNLSERKVVFNKLVSVWEKTRLPKGLSLPDKDYFYRQDRARHYAFRRADMSYLICDEQLLGLEVYLTKLQDYIIWYKNQYLEAHTPS